MPNSTRHKGGGLDAYFHEGLSTPWSTKDGNAYWTLAHQRLLVLHGVTVVVQSWDVGVDWRDRHSTPFRHECVFSPPSTHVCCSVVLPSFPTCKVSFFHNLPAVGVIVDIWIFVSVRISVIVVVG